MKKILVSMIVTMFMCMVAACGKGEQEVAKESKTNVKTETADEKDTINEETSNEAETSEETKKISHTKTAVGKDSNGDKATVEESFYAGVSDVSKYKIKIESSTYREVNIEFEGPKGFSSYVAMDNSNVVMSSGENELRIICYDFIAYTDAIMGETSDYEEALKSMQTDEQFAEDMRNTPGEDWVKLFAMQEASSYAQVNEDHVLVLDEAPFSPEARLAGYAGLKWYYKEPLMVMCFYAEQVDKYNDENAVNIYNSMTWDFVS